MDEDLENIEPEVESWYSAELRQLRSANEHVAFYSANQHVFDQENVPGFSEQSDYQDGQYAEALLLPKQIHTSLDPFVALPAGVNDYQKLRVQLCKVHVSCPTPFFY